MNLILIVKRESERFPGVQTYRVKSIKSNELNYSRNLLKVAEALLK